MRTEVAALVVVALAASGTLCAQERRQAPDGGMRYDAKHETTVSGTIVRSYTGPFGELTIVEVAVDGKPLHLMLAPPDVVTKHRFDFTAGAAFSATGVPGFKVNGGVAMLIRELRVGKRTLTLRDAAGKPTW
jgi:hypothetical protein